MAKTTAAQREFLENTTLLAAMRLVFGGLAHAETGTRRLREFAETASGGTPDRKQSAYFNGKTAWIKSGELNDGLITISEEYITEDGLAHSSAKIFPRGTLVVALYGATVGRTGILNMEAATNQAVCAIFPRADIAMSQYLYWFFRFKRPDFLNESFGGAQPNISQKVLRETVIPIPPIQLQNDVCRFLESVELRQKGKTDTDIPSLFPPLSDVRRAVLRIEGLVHAIKEARRLKQQSMGLVELLLSSRMDEIFSLSESVKTARIADVCRMASGGTPSRTHPEFFENGDIPWIKSGELKDCTIFEAEEHITKEGLASSNAKVFSKGTLLIALYGANVGRTGILGIDAATNQAVCGIFPREELLDRAYVYWFLRKMRPTFIDISIGGAQPNISQKILRRTEIPLLPLSQQYGIAEELERLQIKVNILKKLQSETSNALDTIQYSVTRWNL